jgi:hypothetical protein
MQRFSTMLLSFVGMWQQMSLKGLSGLQARSWYLINPHLPISESVAVLDVLLPQTPTPDAL